MTTMSSSPSLPSDLQTGHYAEARVKEIKGLAAYIGKQYFFTRLMRAFVLQITSFSAAPRQGQSAAQQLPRHLRRRAVSHHPNRLPRRLRQRHCAERDKSNAGAAGGGKAAKRPSRKWRRRPKNLLQEYNRRQRKDGKVSAKG